MSVFKKVLDYHEGFVGTGCHLFLLVRHSRWRWTVMLGLILFYQMRERKKINITVKPASMSWSIRNPGFTCRRGCGNSFKCAQRKLCFSLLKSFIYFFKPCLCSWKHVIKANSDNNMPFEHPLVNVRQGLYAQKQPELNESAERSRKQHSSSLHPLAICGGFLPPAALIISLQLWS